MQQDLGVDPVQTLASCARLWCLRWDGYGITTETVHRPEPRPSLSGHCAGTWSVGTCREAVVPDGVRVTPGSEAGGRCAAMKPGHGL